MRRAPSSGSMVCTHRPSPSPNVAPCTARSVVTRCGAPRPSSRTRTRWVSVGSSPAVTHATPRRSSTATNSRSPSAGSVSARTSVPSRARRSSVQPPARSVIHRKPEPSASQCGDSFARLSHASSRSVSSTRVAPVESSTASTASSRWSRAITTSVSGPRFGHVTAARYGQRARSHRTHVGAPPPALVRPSVTSAFSWPGRG